MGKSAKILNLGSIENFKCVLKKVVGNEIIVTTFLFFFGVQTHEQPPSLKYFGKIPNPKV